MKKVAIIFLFLSIIFQSCDKTKTIELSPQNSELSFNTKEAENWFKNSFLNQKGAKMAIKGKSQFGKRAILWDYAYSYKNENGSITVFAPLAIDEEMPIITLNTDKNKPSKSGGKLDKKLEWSFNTRKVAITKYGNGEIVTHLLTYIYDEEKFKKYKKTSNKFSGIIIAYDWDENFKFGNAYENGKLTNNLVAQSDNKKGAKVKDCYAIFTDYFYRVCYGSDCSDGSYNFTSTQFFCMDEPASHYYTYYFNPYHPTGGGTTQQTAHPNAYKYEVINTICGGYGRMWNLQTAGGSGSSIEILGFITTDDKIIIPPTLGNTIDRSITANFYEDSNGRRILSFFYEDNKWQVETYGINGEYAVYTIKGIAHTHPIPPAGFINDFPSETIDLVFAIGYPTLDLFIVENNSIIKFNQHGEISRTTNNCH